MDVCFVVLSCSTAAGYLKLLSLYVNEILTAVWNVAQFWEGRAYIFNHAAGYLNLMSPNVRAEVNLQKQRSTIAVLVSSVVKKNLWKCSQDLPSDLPVIAQSWWSKDHFRFRPGAATSCLIFRSVSFLTFSSEQFTLSSDAPNAKSIFCFSGGMEQTEMMNASIT